MASPAKTSLTPHPSPKPVPPPSSALLHLCNAFEQAVGGREALIAHLAHAELSHQEEQLLGAIADPTHDRMSLARICQVAKLQYGVLLKVFARAGAARAYVEGMRRVWQRTPDLAEDFIGRALPHFLPCEVCRGLGTVMVWEPAEGEAKKMVEVERVCGSCRGERQVLHQPTLERQKVALELTGLLKDKPQVQIQDNRTSNILAIGGDLLGRFLASSDEVLYGQKEREAPVEAEVVQGSAEGAEVGHETGGDGDAGGARSFEQELDEDIAAREEDDELAGLG